MNIGPTAELSLRVSVAALVRVVFQNPIDGEWMLALERKATLRETGNKREIQVKSQPFGGAIRILDLSLIHDLIGEFHFDSEHSRAEQDFRIFIRPSAWSALRDDCLQHFNHEEDRILETNPERELAEEFADALKINLKPEQYICKPVSTLVENETTLTDNFHSRGSPTVRVYGIFEAWVTDSHVIEVMLENSASISDQDLRKLAWTDFRNGGNGWANAVLVLPLRDVTKQYLGILPLLREKNVLDGSVSAILEEVEVSKYQNLL